MIKVDKPTSHTSNVDELFTGKIFRVPNYQRAYAWERQNWEDFWNDIKEGLETQTPHYWGTFTLRNTGESRFDRESVSPFTIYDVVDGQQRLTTILLFLLALSKAGERGIKDKFIKCGDIHRIELGSLNKRFLADIVDDGDPLADFKTNRLLKGALEYFENQVKSYINCGDDIGKLIEYFLGSTLSLEFQVKDENLAIRAFQSLNDRGKELTLLDKTKSFLMFYSSRYLDSQLSDEINRSFGEVFKTYDIIGEIGSRANIAYIVNPRYRFSEDELLRFFYHYFARYAINQYSLGNLGYDYTITTQNVFKQFLKQSCSLLKSERKLLRRFMEDFLSSFTKFVDSFGKLVESAESNTLHRKMFSFLGLSAAVYPLVISLESEGLGDGDLLRAMEALDLRVYKVRGTNPRADLYKDTISRVKLRPNTNEIHRGIKSFVEDFMRDTEFQTYLDRSMYGNPAVKYILWEFEKHQTPSLDEWDIAFYNGLQVEHIFPVEPTFSFPAYEFEEAEYLDNIHRLGNLTLLEESINKRIGNAIPKSKVVDYQKSKVPGTQKLGYDIDNRGFCKGDIASRNDEIVEFCLQRWNL